MQLTSRGVPRLMKVRRRKWLPGLQLARLPPTAPVPLYLACTASISHSVGNCTTASHGPLSWTHIETSVTFLVVLQVTREPTSRRLRTFSTSLGKPKSLQTIS